MYPFNRIRDFRVRSNKTPKPDLVESAGVGFSNTNVVEEDTGTNSPETKNFIASVLELSTPDQRWSSNRCGR
uniref:Uncharacterized protein n=1 Tax=Panagrolaimus sp. PS1159 TaxID=55785 RepID=A0AC35G556_9BILA